MQLIRIQVFGFGCLRGTDLQFGRGVNLVIGPNEAGKSTLQEAILTGLYGLEPARLAGRSADGDRSNRWRPWHADVFGLALEFELQDGTRMRVERDLDAETVRVVDLDSDTDITGRFMREPPEGLQVGKDLLGITKEIYNNTACISRAEVLRLEEAGAIREALGALADSAQTEKTAQRVLDRLRQERVQKVGRPRGRTGPLHELAARLAELEHAIEAARQTRKTVEELAQKHEAVAALTDAELSVIRTLEAAVLGGRLDEAKRRLERLQQVERLIQEETARQERARFASFPRDRDDEVRRLRTHLRAIREAQDDFRQRSAEVQDRVRQLEAERQQLAAEVHDQENRARGIDDAALQEESVVRELVSSLTFADAQAPEAHLRVQTFAEEVRRAAERHPGLIGPNLDWPVRRVRFQRAYSEWKERNDAAVETRDRAGVELSPRLEQLKTDLPRFKEVPEIIKAAQQAEETMRREEAMAERARARYGTFGVLTLGGVLLMAVAFLVAFVGLQVGPLVFIAASFLLGMGLLGSVLGILARGTAMREVERRLAAKDEARLRRREILSPWGVRHSAELQEALVQHLEKARADATRLELDRQAAELEQRAQAAARSLRELVGSWGLPQPAPTEDAIQETGRLLEALAEETAVWSAAQQRWEEARQTETDLDQRREALRQRLHAGLDRLGFDRQEALAAGHEFLAACESARRAEQLRTRIEQLDAQLDQLRQPAERARSEAQKATEYERQLTAVYALAGIEAGDLEAASRAWDAAVTQAAAYDASTARLGLLHQQRAAIAGEEETPALERLIDDLSRQLEETMVGCDSKAVAEYRTLPLAELERQRDQHRAAKERAQEERARAEELLNDRLMQIGDVAALEEEIVAVREQLRELEAQAQAYDLAIDTLEAAARSVRRAVIPQLKAQLQEHLSSITNGRYRDVEVAEDLGLRVKARDQRAFTDVDYLSLGTRSLIYLLQRVTLARIISGNAEPLPLLLDEALVHTDRRRIKAAMGELARLGQEHQIILFSKDEGLAERGERAGDWTIIRLPGPAATVPAAVAFASEGDRPAPEPETVS